MLRAEDRGADDCDDDMISCCEECRVRRDDVCDGANAMV